MTVKISCPSCDFSKEIPEEEVPFDARWATCPRCKHRFELSLPKSGFDFEQDGRGTKTGTQIGRKATAWENRSELGLWQGIYRTFKSVLFSPGNFFSTITFKGGKKDPLAFGLLLGSIGTMFGLFWYFLMTSGGLMAYGDELIGQFTMSLVFLGVMIISPLFVTMIIFLTSGIMHLFLLIVGAGRNGFEATFRVMAYSQAVQIFGLIPFIGGIIGGLWLLIVQVVGLREIHETSYFRVIIAILIPLTLILLLVVGAVISLFVVGFH